uniref:Bm13072, isoform b n=1 Tax=Brugia malayi TaxID=6279 RepID=A0A1I9G1N3_BRUMA|nr:Bm13072, isoform b [Brugia malayi]
MALIIISTYSVNRENAWTVNIVNFQRYTRNALSNKL